MDGAVVVPLAVSEGVKWRSEMTNSIKTMIVAAVLVGAMATNASAGGLFGKKGVFRGTVGNWLDKHVEQPITTPIAQGLAVAGGAVGGAVVGSYVGQPEAGAAAGAGLGHCVNRVFAGEHTCQ